MAANTKRQRRQRGSAWHWRQTDCWYYTPPGTKRRVRLVDEDGKPVRGKDNRQAAELALARVKVAGQGRASNRVLCWLNTVMPWTFSDFVTLPCASWAMVVAAPSGSVCATSRLMQQELHSDCHALPRKSVCVSTVRSGL